MPVSTRSVRDITDALWSVCEWDEEASALADRFRRESMYLHWDETRPLPIADDYIDINVDEVEFGDVLVYLVASTTGNRKDPIVWRARACNRYDNQDYRLLFVDAQACHPDWFGLRLFSEIANLYVRVNIDDVAREMAPVLPPMNDGELDFHLQHSLVHLDDQASRLVFRLLDRRMRGRVTQTVLPMRKRLPPPGQIKDMVRSLSEEIYDQLEYTWEPSRNADERRVRTQLTLRATLGAVKQLLGRQVVSH